MFNFVEGDVPLPTSRPRNPLALKLSSGSESFLVLKCISDY